MLDDAAGSVAIARAAKRNLSWSLVSSGHRDRPLLRALQLALRGWQARRSPAIQEIVDDKLLPCAAAAAAPVDPNTFLNQFESIFGKVDGCRRSGAKGICAVGEFVGTAEARALSTASAFSGRPVPVVVRFSVDLST